MHQQRWHGAAGRDQSLHTLDINNDRWWWLQTSYDRLMHNCNRSSTTRHGQLVYWPTWRAYVLVQFGFIFCYVSIFYDFQSVCVCVLIRVRESSGACRGVVVANAGSCRDAIAIRLLQNSGVRLVCLQEMPDLQRNAPPSDDLTHRVSVLLWLLVDRGKLGGTTVPPGEREA